MKKNGKAEADHCSVKHCVQLQILFPCFGVEEGMRAWFRAFCQPGVLLASQWTHTPTTSFRRTVQLVPNVAREAPWPLLLHSRPFLNPGPRGGVVSLLRSHRNFSQFQKVLSESRRGSFRSHLRGSRTHFLLSQSPRHGFFCQGTSGALVQEDL